VRAPRPLRPARLRAPLRLLLCRRMRGRRRREAVFKAPTLSLPPPPLSLLLSLYLSLSLSFPPSLSVSPSLSFSLSLSLSLGTGELAHSAPHTSSIRAGSKRYPCWYLVVLVLSSVQFSIQEQLLRRDVKRFRGGLVFKAHRLLSHSTLGSRVIKKEKKY
jgi:hypothetical protein